MPICQNCDQKWTWKQTMKTLFKFICPYCGKKQYESASSQLRNSILGIVILLIFSSIVIWFNLSVGIASMLVIILSMLTLGSYPFMLKLSNHKEYFTLKYLKMKKLKQIYFLSSKKRY